MNFDIATGYRDLIFSKSVRPMEIKEETKNWKLLQGYVYVMSKKFRPFPEDPERLLIKIGYSDFEADDGRDKYLQRSQTHKTSLISFKVHRIYLYTDGGASTLKGKAYDAEQNLHRLVVELTIHHQSGLHLTKREQTEKSPDQLNGFGSKMEKEV